MGVARNSEKVYVEIGGKSRSDISVKVIERYSGSSQRDAAVMEVVNVGENDKVDTAFELADKFPNQICKIALRSGQTLKYVHYGRITGGRYSMSGTESSLELISRFDDQLLGEPLKSRNVQIVRGQNQPITVVQTLDRELVFNPRYEGRIYGNKTFGYALNLIPLFIDLNAIELPFLTLPSTNQFTLWSIPDAVHYLCSDLNSSETHVKNPTWTELKQILPTNVYLNNVSLPVGVFLGEALDRILNPFGYHWKITHDSSTLRRIEVFSRNEPYRNTVSFQKHVPNSVFDDENDLLPEINLSVDHNDNAYNRVTIIGARKRSEITVNLLPDWDTKLEGQSISSFFWDSPAMRANTSLRYVYRRFKADLSLLSNLGITNNVAARRPMLPCLTLDAKGQPYGTHRGVFVEVSLDGGKTWKSVDSTGVIGGLKQAFSLEIMENESAVLFTGKIFPAYYRKYGQLFKLRATATFELDECLVTSVGIALAGKPLFDEKELVVSAPDRFQLHERELSVLKSVSSSAAVIDQTSEMAQFANELLSAHTVTSITGKISMHGVDNIDKDYLGASVLEIPRSVFLKTSPVGTEKYPACTGIIYDIDSQQTQLLIGVLN